MPNENAGEISNALSSPGYNVPLSHLKSHPDTPLFQRCCGICSAVISSTLGSHIKTFHHVGNTFVWIRSLLGNADASVECSSLAQVKLGRVEHPSTVYTRGPLGASINHRLPFELATTCSPSSRQRRSVTYYTRRTSGGNKKGKVAKHSPKLRYMLRAVRIKNPNNQS